VDQIIILVRNKYLFVFLFDLLKCCKYCVVDLLFNKNNFSSKSIKIIIFNFIICCEEIKFYLKKSNKIS
jgi:hypothetical protein